MSTEASTPRTETSIEVGRDDTRPPTNWAHAFMVVFVSLIIGAALAGQGIVDSFQPCDGQVPISVTTSPDGLTATVCR